MRNGILLALFLATLCMGIGVLYNHIPASLVGATTWLSSIYLLVHGAKK